MRIRKFCKLKLLRIKILPFDFSFFTDVDDTLIKSSSLVKINASAGIGALQQHVLTMEWNPHVISRCIGKSVLLHILFRDLQELVFFGSQLLLRAAEIETRESLII